MLRGTLVLFAGFFTVLVLRRRLYIHHWLGMALITGGAALVGAASVLSKGTGAPATPPSPPPYFPPPGNGSVTAAGGSSGVYDAYGGAAAGGGGLMAGVRRLLVAAVAGGEPEVDAASAPLFGDLCVVAAQAFTALQVGDTQGVCRDMFYPNRHGFAACKEAWRAWCTWRKSSCRRRQMHITPAAQALTHNAFAVSWGRRFAQHDLPTRTTTLSQTGLDTPLLTVPPQCLRTSASSSPPR